MKRPSRRIGIAEIQPLHRTASGECLLSEKANGIGGDLAIGVEKHHRIRRRMCEMG